MTRAGICDWETAWTLTPRQLKALLYIESKARDKEKAEQLEVGILATRGDKRAIDKKLKEWTK